MQKTIKKDWRKIDRKTQEWIRMRAIELVVKENNSPEKVIKDFWLNRWCIYDWLKKYKEKWIKALKSKTAPWAKSILNDKELKKLQKLLIKDPNQLHFEFWLWTIVMIKKLIKKEFNKTVSEATVSRVLAKIWFTNQKPLFRAYQQCPKRVEKWKEEQYPKIKEEAKKEWREIFFEDESWFRSTNHKWKTWSKKWNTPVVRTTGARFWCNCISAISQRWSMNFMVYEWSFNADVFIDFLKRLLKNRKQKITLVVDWHRSHNTKKVQEFIESTKWKLKIYFLPPYSPELNPDELVWNNLKGKVNKVFKGKKDDFIARVKSHLFSLQKNKKLIKSFFKHPDVGYLV